MYVDLDEKYQTSFVHDNSWAVSSENLVPSNMLKIGRFRSSQCMHKVSLGHLLSSDTFCSIQ